LLNFGHKNRAGWILAGGKSSRMGTDKALLSLEGTPLILCAVTAAAAVCGSVSLVGDPARYSRLGFPVVADTFPGAGPVAGIEAALHATTADWNLILACDMPALSPAVLETLFIGDDTVDCALPKYPDGKVEPLCAVYHRHCHPHIRAALEHGLRKVTIALEGLAIRYIPVTSEESFTNLNAPEDVRRYKNG
jgi:molybdopterin-guanine dinucleotide biosynthesis protein A